MPKWDGERIKTYKLFVLYVVGNWCENVDGRPMNNDILHKAAQVCMFDGRDSNTRPMTFIAEGTDAFARVMVPLIELVKDWAIAKTQRILDEKKEQLKVAGLEIRVAPQ